MYVINDGWVRQASAICPRSDLEGRKSRIRRSKEERKSLAESFIKKYQKSNNGSFPSLNITHKEVGGSFYTVREIVRDIIQENRVLTSPKRNLEEYDQFLGYGSMATELQNDFLVSDRNHLMNKSPCQYGIKNEESNGPESLDLKIIKGLSKMANKEEGYKKNNLLLDDHHQDANVEETSNLGEQLPAHDTHEFETEIFVSGGEVLDEHPVSDKSIITIDQDKCKVDVLEPVQNFDAVETVRLNKEQYSSKNNQQVEKTKELGQIICTESVVMETLLGATTSHVNSDVMETLLGATTFSGLLKDKTRQHEKRTYIGCPSGVNENEENKLLDSTLELDDELRDEKMVQNHQDPYVECSRLSTPFESFEIDICDVKDLEYEVRSALKPVVSEESLATVRNSCDYVTSSAWKGSRPPLLDRISLETWKRESNKSSRHQSNPLLEFVKSYMVAFVKFWSK